MFYRHCTVKALHSPSPGVTDTKGEGGRERAGDKGERERER